jgi:hypothetical protein
LTINEVHSKNYIERDDWEGREKEGRGQTSFSLMIIEFVKSTYVIDEQNSFKQ